eukprot:TRINITY_DN7436_c0_g2_i2.p1 TRINITY_DN7436_c0_g2~~TRINITY_DN7436_c0_g2_i2.p1  ORF type:complete len:1069 (-),score=226.64 TRINITY_DN7436_c0_g2_i2:186-3392(-)
MRIYIHFSGEPEFTYLAKVNEEALSSEATAGNTVTVAKITQNFLAAFNAKNGPGKLLQLALVEVSTDRGRVVPLEALASKVVKDKGDLFVRETVPVQVPEETGTAAITPEDEATGRRAVQNATSSTKLLEGSGDGPRRGSGRLPVVERTSDEGLETSVAIVLVTKALEAQHQERYKEAAALFRQVLEITPGQMICLRALASMAIDINRPERALPVLEEAVKAHPHDAAFHARLGDVCVSLGDYDLAFSCYETALSLLSLYEFPPPPSRSKSDAARQRKNAFGRVAGKGGSSRLAGGDAAQKSLESPQTRDGSYSDGAARIELERRNGVGAIRLPGKKAKEKKMIDLKDRRTGDVQGPVTRDGVKVALAHVLRKKGQGDLATQLVVQMLQLDEYSIPALLEYGHILLETGQETEAMKVFLRVFLKESGNEVARAQLARALQHPKAMALLQSEMHALPNASTSAALASLATVIKDYGAVEEAAQLCTEAVKLAPLSANLSLQLLHTLEVLNRACAGLLVVKDWCRRQTQRKIGDLKLGDVLPIFEDLPLHAGSCWPREASSPRQGNLAQGPHLPNTQAEHLRVYDWEFPGKEEPQEEPSVDDKNQPNASTPVAGETETKKIKVEENGAGEEGREQTAGESPCKFDEKKALEGEEGTQAMVADGRGNQHESERGDQQEGEHGTERGERVEGACGEDARSPEMPEESTSEGRSSRLLSHQGGSGTNDRGISKEQGALRNNANEKEGQSDSNRNGHMKVMRRNAFTWSANEAVPAGRGQKVYSNEELDAFALLATTAKILFLGGAVKRAEALVRCLDPVRGASSVPFHETLIRNEAAYFSCVRQILVAFPLGAPSVPLVAPGDSSADPRRPLYFLGDSHCLAPAWREVELRRERRVLVPLLVTGLKLWHLRAESVFYPKRHFANVVRRIPDGSQLIVLFGEIDCREGIFFSVLKDRYEDWDAGIAATISIYAKILLGLTKERGMEVFVHPIPPVLTETRAMVQRFNRALRRKVEALAGKSDKGGEEEEKVKLPRGKGGRLHWLGFEDGFLDGQGKRGKGRAADCIGWDLMTAF